VFRDIFLYKSEVGNKVTLEQHLVLKPLFYADIFLQSTKFPYFGFAIKKVLIAFKSFLLKIS